MQELASCSGVRNGLGKYTRRRSILQNLFYFLINGRSPYLRTFQSADDSCPFAVIREATSFVQRLINLAKLLVRADALFIFGIVMQASFQMSKTSILHLRVACAKDIVAD